MEVYRLIFDEHSREIIESVIGRYQIIGDRRKNNDRTGVIEALADGGRYYVKIHNKLLRWHSEVHAYKNWTGNIGNMAPQFVASFNQDNIFGIVTTPITGKTVNEMGIEDDELLLNIYFEAGKLYKTFQSNHIGMFFGEPKIDGTPYDEFVTNNPIEYLCRAFENIFKSGYDKEIFHQKHKALMEWCMNHLEAFIDDYPVPTNWDFSQNNWMVDKNGRFTGFIDFENTLWGLPLDSFGVIIERYTFGKPYLRKAFFEGYGLENDELTQLKMRILTIKMALADMNNGYCNHHPRFYECGKRMLQYLMDNPAK